MNARADKTETGDIAALMRDMGTRARAAARVLALADSTRKEKALRAAAKAIRAQSSAILQANAEDIAAAREQNATPAFLDRLSLDAKRVAVHGRRRRCGGQPSRSGRRGDRELDAAQWLEIRARAHASGRRRGGL